MATPFNLVSKDAQTRLTEFSTELDQALALGEVQKWSSTLGRCAFVLNSAAIQTKFPIPVSAAGYVKRKGDDRMRELFEKSASCQIFEWEDGVTAPAAVVEAPDFVGWVGEPERIALETERLGNTLVANMFELASGAGPTLEFDGLSLFNNAHPFNVFKPTLGTFDNNRSSAAFDSVMVDLLYTHFRGIKGPNGKPMGRRLTDIIVGSDLERTAVKFFESDLMYNAQLATGSNTNQVSNNIYKGKVNVIVSDELTTTGVLYGLDRNGPPIYVLQDGGQPEEIRFDKTDGLYKRTGKIGVKYVKKMSATALLPHSIVRMHIGGSE